MSCFIIFIFVNWDFFYLIHFIEGPWNKNKSHFSSLWTIFWRVQGNEYRVEGERCEMYFLVCRALAQQFENCPQVMRAITLRFFVDRKSRERPGQAWSKSSPITMLLVVTFSCYSYLFVRSYTFEWWLCLEQNKIPYRTDSFQCSSIISNLLSWVLNSI